MKLSTITLAAIKAADLPGGVPSPNAEEGAVFGVLKHMALLKHDDSGFSFVTTVDFLETWLDDADFEDGQPVHAAYASVKALVVQLKKLGTPAILVSLDDDFDRAMKPLEPPRAKKPSK